MNEWVDGSVIATLDSGEWGDWSDIRRRWARVWSRLDAGESVVAFRRVRERFVGR